MNEVGSINGKDYKQYYFNNFGRREERLLTKDELNVLHVICEIGVKNNFDFILGFSSSAFMYCIHKTPQDEWIISGCGERDSGSIDGVFDNIYDAGISLIHMCVNDEIKASTIIDDFNEQLKKNISEEELEDFAYSCGYYDQFFYNDFCYAIKKMSEIDVEEDEEANERISNRKKRDFPSETDFDYLVTIFINNIARKARVNIKELDDSFHDKKIDYETYKKQKVERVLKVYKDLVLMELEKYKLPMENKVKKLKIN